LHNQGGERIAAWRRGRGHRGSTNNEVRETETTDRRKSNMGSDDFFQSVQLDVVTLRVADLERTRAFYERGLGFQARETADGVLTLSPDGGAPLIELESSPSAPARRPGSAGLFHVALLFPSRRPLGRMLSHLMRSGVRIGSADHGVSEALYLADPEGNGLELYVDRPVAAWPAADAGGQVTMFTDALDLASLSAAGAGAPDPLLPAGVRIGHMHLSVSSLDRAEEFYGERLGFAVRQRTYPGALFLARDGYHHHLGTNTWHSRNAVTPGSRGLVRFGMRFSDARERDQILSGTRAHVTGPGPHGGTLLRDFDGIEIEIG
jgi:catechol 2,3-dioxygenase